MYCHLRRAVNCFHSLLCHLPLSFPLSSGQFRRVLQSWSCCRQFISSTMLRPPFISPFQPRIRTCIAVLVVLSAVYILYHVTTPIHFPLLAANSCVYCSLGRAVGSLYPPPCYDPHSFPPFSREFGRVLQSRSCCRQFISTAMSPAPFIPPFQQPIRACIAVLVVLSAVYILYNVTTPFHFPSPAANSGVIAVLVVLSAVYILYHVTTPIHFPLLAANLCVYCSLGRAVGSLYPLPCYDPYSFPPSSGQFVRVLQSWSCCRQFISSTMLRPPFISPFQPRISDVYCSLGRAVGSLYPLPCYDPHSFLPSSGQFWRVLQSGLCCRQFSRWICGRRFWLPVDLCRRKRSRCGCRNSLRIRHCFAKKQLPQKSRLVISI